MYFRLAYFNYCMVLMLKVSKENLIKIVSDGSGIDETISCCKLKLDK